MIEEKDLTSLVRELKQLNNSCYKLELQTRDDYVWNNASIDKLNNYDSGMRMYYKIKKYEVKLKC